MQQTDKSWYNFRKYATAGRFVSYFHQLDEVIALKPVSVLEIGVGDHVFGGYLKDNTDIKYESLDVASDLNPTHTGSVEKIPLPSSSYDVVCVFEVLEHLPFEKLEQSLSEMARVSKRYVVVSIPHFGPPVKLSLKLPFFPEIKLAWKIPYPRAHVFNGQHYWEIGKKGYPSAVVRSKFEKCFKILKEFIPFESQYHHFFVLQKR